jgi:L-sorbose 1-phosphate reductase
MTMTIPEKQRAVQLVGPDQLRLNEDKAVFRPGPYQILGRVEVVGLCFSDLKLLKQFSAHVRKSDVVAGLGTEVLGEIPSYVPNERPVVPGHETVVRVVAAGDRVTSVKPGGRYLVQTDYRWLKTAQSNAAFGYNFEGALQEYVLMDERVITSPEGESMLIPADESLSASAVALVEPWACVEDSYVVRERPGLKSGGRLLIVASPGVSLDGLAAGLPDLRACGRVLWLGASPAPNLGGPVETVREAAGLPAESLDDVIFLGGDAALLEAVFPKVAAGGLVNLVLGGQSFGRPVVTPVGRIHYGGVRLTGTAGADPREGYRVIPPTGEIRPGDRIHVVGAGGPMGTMHVIRNLCQGTPGVTVVGGDMAVERLDALRRAAAPIAQARGLGLELYNPKEKTPAGPFNYIALMVPVAALVAEAVRTAAPRGIVNIFAGIPATVAHPLDLDTVARQQLYFIGTSGSVLEDMKIVLRKVTGRVLDTNLSVAAISGLEGAVDGIRAVEKGTIPGKILVYPSVRGLGLTPLTDLPRLMPDVAAKLDRGLWTAAAEKALLART